MWIVGRNRSGSRNRRPGGTTRPTVIAALLVLAGLPPITLAVNAPGLAGAVAASAAEGGDPVIAAAGDIACPPGDEPQADECRQMDTSDILVGLNPDAVLPIGDLQYENGSASSFAQSYDPSWGRLKAISRPVPGNKEYGTSGAAGYFGYFGSLAGDPSRGYYSWDIGTWHMIAINSNCSEVGGCGAGSPQETWLRADLAAHPDRCTLAYWHHPRFGSASSSSSMGPIWTALYQAGADVVLNGHSHVYEHFAPQSPSGAADPEGLRQFTVGTGGVEFGDLGSIRPNTVARQNDTFGVLKMVLRGSSYTWEFLPVAGSSWTDSGTAACHSGDAPPAPAAPTGLQVTGTTETSVGLGWTASSGPDVAGYRVYRDGAPTPLNGSLITGTSYTDTTVAPGTTHSYRVTAVNTSGVQSAPSAAVSATTPGGDPGGGGTTGLDLAVAGSADDAEERTSGGTVTLGSGDLNLGQDGARAQHVGMRFAGVTIPRGATITDASVQFQVDEASTAPANLAIAGQAADSAPAFTTATGNVSSRTRTAAAVSWAPAAWPTAGARGADQRTPNLAAVLQEIVSRPGWDSGNALALIVTGTGERTAESVDGGAPRAPVLHIAYTTGGSPPANVAPTVSAGSDVAVTRPNAAALAGTVDDDGLPNPPGAVTANWSKVSGPGTVTFSNATATSTSATFSAAGDYVLRLTGHDGSLQASDDVAVTVSDPTGPANLAPTVSAGSDVAVTRPNAAALAGTVDDDGLPNPPGAVTASWSKVSGPGTVTFSNATATSTSATFSAAGDYVLRLTGNDGSLQASDDVAVTVSDGSSPGPAVVLDLPVLASADDAEERIIGGAVTLGSGDLNLGQDGARAQICALRFTGVTIPRGATITAAWLQFQVDEASTATTQLTVFGEAADNAAAFTTATSSLSSRERTGATVAWTPASWPTAGARTLEQRTPDLSAVLQEIVDRGGWGSGGALALFVTGTGERTAESRDGGAARAPVLHVEYVV
jgi:hypothetical protein